MQWQFIGNQHFCLVPKYVDHPKGMYPPKSNQGEGLIIVLPSNDVQAGETNPGRMLGPEGKLV